LGILKFKISFWSLPQLLLITALLLVHIINTYYNYYISNKVPLEECDKVENMEVTGAATTSFLKKKNLKCFSHCHVYARSQPDQGPIQCFGDLYKNVSLAALFGNSNSYTVCTQSDCVFERMFVTIYKSWSGKKKNGTVVNAACHKFASPGIGTVIQLQWSGLRIHVDDELIPLQKRPYWVWSPPRILFSGYRRFFPGVKRPGVHLTTRLHLVPRLIMNGAIHLFPLYAFRKGTGTLLLPLFHKAMPPLHY
jgi:hypothetical protein